MFKKTLTGINLKRSRLVAVMALTISTLVIIACLVSILDESIYNDVLKTGIITQFLLIGSRAQDIVSIALAIILTFLSINFLKNPNYKILVTIIGLCSSFFYGYGLYTIQGQYTRIYLIYLAIFSLSIYTIILGILSFEIEFAQKTKLPRKLGMSICIFLYIIVFLLGGIWIIRILPNILKHIPCDTYGVFVLDLGVVFPAIIISAALFIKRKAYGNILIGIVLMKVVTICISWGFAECYTRIKGSVQSNYEMILISGLFALVGLIFFVLYILKEFYKNKWSLATGEGHAKLLVISTFVPTAYLEYHVFKNIAILFYKKFKNK